MYIYESFVERFGQMNVKYAGSFALRSEAAPIRGVQYYADRWSPLDDRSKDMISSMRERDEEWVSVPGTYILYGLEQESVLWPEHVFDYYNLIVLRPFYISAKEALKCVSEFRFSS